MDGLCGLLSGKLRLQRQKPGEFADENPAWRVYACRARDLQNLTSEKSARGVAAMLPEAPRSIYQSPKCFITYGTTGHVDPKQIPRKSKPWSNITSLDFVHKVDLILPMDSRDAFHQKLVQDGQPPVYCRVTMTLAHVLEQDFLTEYIKKRDILMLSEGTNTVDNMFTLKKGVLTMYLDKETYERAGLVGKPHGVKGSRGLKPRWVVSYDLTSSTMMHGKKGFDRLFRACNNVLKQPLTWLFCNVDRSTPSPDPLEKHFPSKFTSSPGVVQDISTTNVSPVISSEILAQGDRSALEIEATELYEWLSLIRLGSPRVAPNDSIDPHLSGYVPPSSDDGELRLLKISWQGFMCPAWVRELLGVALTTISSQSWIAMSVTEFSKGFPATSNEITFLRPPKAAGEFLMWEIRNPE